MAFLLEVNDIPDENCAEIFLRLVDQWFCNEEFA
jgi:hypothetical protein